jgi:hypothetical protein
MENVNVGIDKVKAVVKVALDVVLQYKKAKEDDGKITPLEYLGFVDELMAVVKVVPHGKTILLQLQDMDDAETLELVDYIERYGILKEKAVIILKNVLQALETLYDIYNDNVLPIVAALKK